MRPWSASRKALRSSSDRLPLKNGAGILLELNELAPARAAVAGYHQSRGRGGGGAGAGRGPRAAPAGARRRSRAHQGHVARIRVPGCPG